MMWLPREIAPVDRLGPAGLFGIWRFCEEMKAQTLRFINSWSADDAYDRFGSAGIGGQEWLATQLTQCGRRALVAVNANGVVGLLDHTDAGDATHIGIVVDARYRRISIGSTLVRALLQSNAIRRPIVADCSSRNTAAVTLLRTCEFKVVENDGYELTWRYK